MMIDEGCQMFVMSSRREELDFRLVERIIRCTYLNAYLPISTHTKIAASAEMTLAVRLEVDCVGSHIHVEHGCVERDTHVGIGPAVAIQDTDCKRVGTETVG